MQQKLQEKNLQERLVLQKTIAAVATSLVLVSIAPISIKLVEDELTPYATIFNRLVGAGIIFGMWSGFTTIRDRDKDSSAFPSENIKKQDYLLLLLAGFFFWASQTSWSWSLPRTSVAISDLLHNFMPIFVITGGWLLGRKGLTSRFLLGTGFSVIGSCLIGFEHLSSTSHQLQGDMAAILSAAFMGAYMLIGETLCNKFSKITIMFSICITGSVLSVPILLMTPSHWFPLSSQGWLFCIFLVFTMVLGQGLFLYSIEKVGSSFMAVLFLLSPILAAIAAWLVFAEVVTYLDWGAMVIVLLGVYFAISSHNEHGMVRAQPTAALSPEPLSTID